MKRVTAVTAVLVAASMLAVFSAGAGDEGDYKVRAIFDNAGFIIPGEDVKVAGVKVGKIDSLDVTPDFKAAVVLNIQDPGYQDFRADAECQVRPQSLIGEKFVECTPTQKRAVGAEPPPPLNTIERGKGEGQYLLPVENTSKSVDLDLLNNITREPERQRLSLIVAELGTGLAGRGSELNQVIRRANPALKEIDEVLKLLASQNRVLANLARDSDTALAPLARERRSVSSFIEQSSDVAAATAARRADLEASFERLPRFLRELRPTMVRLGSLSDEMTPVLTDLGDAAPDINRLLIELGPFSKAAIPAVDSLGEASKIGAPAMHDALPVARDLRRLGRIARPVGLTARQILESFKKDKGIERLMDYIFYQVAAVNGFDSFGHYLRARLILNTCSRYYTAPVAGCSSKFTAGQEAEASAASTSDPILARTTAALQGEDPDTAAPLPTTNRRRISRSAGGSTGGRRGARWGRRATRRGAAYRAAGAKPAGAKPDTVEPLMDYLFGKDAE
jgi:phospholipid/cholesterol/gamma-HCH transport system substrate-binding protein